MEIWKEIKDFEGLYSISTSGRVLNILTRKFLSANRSKNPYLKVNLTKDKQAKTFKVHRLVAETFLPNPENKPEVNHKDGDKLNNFLSNLEWNTKKENRDHATKNNLVAISRGIKNGNAKLSNYDIQQIKELHKTKQYTHLELSKKFGVSRSLITQIINNLIWTHL